MHGSALKAGSEHNLTRLIITSLQCFKINFKIIFLFSVDIEMMKKHLLFVCSPSPVLL